VKEHGLPGSSSAEIRIGGWQKSSIISYSSGSEKEEGTRVEKEVILEKDLGVKRLGVKGFRHPTIKKKEERQGGARRKRTAGA